MVVEPSCRPVGPVAPPGPALTAGRAGVRGRPAAVRAASVRVVRVLQMWRYPVKSVGGERLDSVSVDAAGLVGDRRWALVESADGGLITARRDPVLLAATAELSGPGLRVRLPDGSVVDSDDGPSVIASAFGQLLGRAVRLIDSTRERPAGDRGDSAVPGLPDDPGQARVSLVSERTLGQWDARRFRSNLLLSEGGEDELIGSRVRLGDALLAVNAGIARCVMVTREQPCLPRDRRVLRVVNAERDGMLAVGATTVQPGRIEVGDRLFPA